MSADPTLRRLHVWSGLIVLGVFVAGFIAGAGVFSWFGRSPSPPSRRAPGGFFAQLSELNLTTEQQRRANLVLEKHHEAVQALLKESFPRINAARDEMDRELRAILTEVQTKKFDEIRGRYPNENLRSPVLPRDRDEHDARGGTRRR